MMEGVPRAAGSLLKMDDSKYVSNRFYHMYTILYISPYFTLPSEKVNISDFVYGHSCKNLMTGEYRSCSAWVFFELQR